MIADREEDAHPPENNIHRPRQPWHNCDWGSHHKEMMPPPAHNGQNFDPGWTLARPISP
jgi:hypothetical protein